MTATRGAGCVATGTFVPEIMIFTTRTLTRAGKNITFKKAIAFFLYLWYNNMSANMSEWQKKAIGGAYHD
jgi:hypothetical protein